MDAKQEKALQFYEAQCERVRKYNQEHRQQIRELVKKSYYKMKEDPERWEAFQAKKKAYYQEKKQKKELLNN